MNSSFVMLGAGFACGVLLVAIIWFIGGRKMQKSMMEAEMGAKIKDTIDQACTAIESLIQAVDFNRFNANEFCVRLTESMNKVSGILKVEGPKLEFYFVKYTEMRLAGFQQLLDNVEGIRSLMGKTAQSLPLIPPGVPTVIAAAAVVSAAEALSVAQSAPEAAHLSTAPVDQVPQVPIPPPVGETPASFTDFSAMVDTTFMAPPDGADTQSGSLSATENIRYKADDTLAFSMDETLPVTGISESFFLQSPPMVEVPDVHTASVASIPVQAGDDIFSAPSEPIPPPEQPAIPPVMPEVTLSPMQITPVGLETVVPTNIEFPTGSIDESSMEVAQAFLFSGTPDSTVTEPAMDSTSSLENSYQSTLADDTATVMYEPTQQLSETSPQFFEATQAFSSPLLPPATEEPQSETAFNIFSDTAATQSIDRTEYGISETYAGPAYSETATLGFSVDDMGATQPIPIPQAPESAAQPIDIAMAIPPVQPSPPASKASNDDDLLTGDDFIDKIDAFFKF